jgi:AraC-like DNA-binding protein
MASEVMHLIGNLEKVQRAPEGLFGANVRHIYERHGGSLASFSREVGHHTKSVLAWMSGQQTPRLYAVAVIAFRYGVQMLDLLESSLRGDIAVPVRPLPHEALGNLKPKLHRHDVDALRKELEEAARGDQFPPPSLAAVGRRLKCHSSYLKRKFPDLAAQISGAYRQHWSIHKSQGVYFARLVTQSKTSEIAARGEYPSQRKINRELPPGICLRMPVVKQAWRETLREWGLKPSLGFARGRRMPAAAASTATDQRAAAAGGGGGVLQANNEHPVLTGKK